MPFFQIGKQNIFLSGIVGVNDPACMLLAPLLSSAVISVLGKFADSRTISLILH